jgi:hypothetical protein
MQALKNKMQIAITPKAPIVIDKTVATNIANGSQDVVNANPVQQPAIPSLDANQLHAIVDGQNAAQELAKQALNKDTLTADDNGLVAQFGALVTRLGLIGTDQAQVLADINKLIADTRAA